MAKKLRCLMIVESPNKCSTLNKILKDAFDDRYFIVMASAGHISGIADKASTYWNTGIEPENKFKINLTISPDKKKVVDQLKEQVALADLIYLAGDPDREGECITYNLKKFLKIPEDKYYRVAFHEITKPAVLKAIQNPGKIDENLVKAALARSIIDKILGYRLSPIARKQIQARSVGRCQSAALKLIVEREEEIQNFKSETYFDLFLHFSKNNTQFKAKFIGDGLNDIDKIKNPDYCKFVIDSCAGHDYLINNIEIKKGNENPKLPFTTSTYQQEVNKKLGISVKDAMAYAQKLFEGINIGGEHIALTTYLRTDSTTMSDDFKPLLAEYVKNTYGIKYYAPVREGKKSDNAQEGHECFRIVDPEMTPEKLSQYVTDDRLIKIYTIIWKRTIASSMASAITSNTEYQINNDEFRFLLKSKEYLFDGYRKVYNYKEDDQKEEIVKETFAKGEVLQNCDLEQVEKQTTPPARYKEATFIKTLEDKAIGRPSTFATIVETILSGTRGYCTIEDKCIVPTQKGIELSHFLDKYFSDTINVEYTKEMEADLDKIANGKLKQQEFLTTFYTDLEKSVEKSGVGKSTAQTIDEKCPKCGKPLVIRSGKFGPFKACTGYPACKYIESIKK